MARVREFDVVGVLVKRPIGLDTDLTKRIPTHKGLGKIKRAVLDQLGVEATVSPEVDVFKENAIHVGIDCGNGFFRLDGQVGAGRPGCQGKEH